jgi:hypothetical protein
VTWDRRDWLALASLLAAPWLFMWRLFVPGSARYYLESGDFVDQFYAFASFETASLAHGKLPLWNPFAYSGSPFWADVQAAVAYPPSLLTAVGSALATGRMPYLALEIEAVAHLALAGAFTYLFIRRVSSSRSGALVGALAFGLGGYLTGYPVLQLAVLESNAWLPLGLLGVAMMIDARPRKGAIVTAFALGMGILAGHPQSALYMIALLAAYAAWRTWPWRSTVLGTWIALGGAVLLALGLSAAGWLPALEYMRLSNRAAVDYATVAHGFPPRELLGVALAGITKWSPLYVGVLPLLLAAAAAIRSVVHRAGAWREGRFWTALAGLALALSLGGRGFLFDVFYVAVPGFDMFRGQERSAFLFSFSLAVLAGLGFAAWRRCDAACAVDRIVGRGGALLAALGLFVVFLGSPDTSRLGARLALLGLAAVVLAALRSRGRVSGTALLAVSVGLIFLDLFAVGSEVNMQPGAPGELQAAAAIDSMKQGLAQRVQNEDRLPRNFGVLHRIESTYGASPLRPQSYDTLYEGLAAAAEPRLWQLLAVRDVFTTRDEIDVPARIVHEETGEQVGYLHRLDAPSPYAWLASEAVRTPDESAALSVLSDPDTDVHHTVTLIESTASTAGDQTESAPAAAAPDVPGNSGSVKVLERHAGLLRAAVNTPAPAWLVVSEVFYPGWRAEIDGHETDIVRADVALMAVAVPAGQHEVRLWFTAPLVTSGIVVSLATAILLAGLAALAWLAPEGSRGASWWRNRPPGAQTFIIGTVLLSALMLTACNPDRSAGRPGTPATAMPDVPGEVAGAPGPSSQPTLAIEGGDAGHPPAQANPAGFEGTAEAPTPTSPTAGSALTPLERRRRSVMPFVVQHQSPGARAAQPAPGSAPHADAPTFGETCTGIAGRDGQQLVLDGQPFQFFGVNAPYLLDEEFPEATAETVLRDLAAREVNTVRVWFFPRHDPDRLDRILAMGDSYGIRFVVTLEDNVNKGRDWFFADEDEKRYRPHLQRTVERFKDRPEILMWEVINEPNCGDRFDDDCLKTMRDWITMSSRMIKQIDACHLVTTGMIGAGNYESEWTNYRRVHKKDTIDVFSSHKRADEDPSRDLDIAADAGKPIFFGEVYYQAYDAGCSPLEGGGVVKQRAEAIKDHMRDAFEEGVDGYLLWDYAPGRVELSDGSTRSYCGVFGYESDDPLWGKLAAEPALPPQVPWSAGR